MRIKQLNVDCYGCRGPLNNPEELTDVMQKAAENAGAKVIGKSVQNYPVYGLTAIVFLAESHVIVSTYPEHKYSVVEVFMCNDQQNPYRCTREITDYLQPEVVKTHEFFHDVGEQPEKK